MKTTIKSLLAGTALMLAACPAMADNPGIEEELRSRSDFSSFYQALVNTGVNRELEPNRYYTIFVPSNAAMAKITPQEYPCFYDAACRPQVAQFVRNHIVPGNIHADDASRDRDRLLTLGDHSVSITSIGSGTPRRSTSLMANGSLILATIGISEGMLYKIDGVMAEDRELALFGSDAAYGYLPAQVTTTTERTMHDPMCRAGDRCPQTVRQTTTVTKTITPMTARAISDQQ